MGLRSGDYQAALIPVGGGEPVRFVKNNEGLEAADEFHFSPNGKWIAFHALSGGRSEVFVVANPPTEERWQVSTRGGVQARWPPGPVFDEYRVAPDGRFLILAPVGGGAIRVIVNWTSLLEKNK